MIQSTGYIAESTIIWELETNQFDFSSSEFQDLIVYIKTGSLFTWLEINRPALKDQLNVIKNQIYLDEEIEESEWQYTLEVALRNLNLRLGL